MSKQFLTEHLNKVFFHMEKRDAIKAEQSAIKENEVFKLRQEAVAKERIAQDQSRQEKIIREQATLRVEQERIALEKLTLKADQEALQRSQKILTEMKNEMLAAKVNIQRKLKAQLEQQEQLEFTKNIIQDKVNEIFDEVIPDEVIPDEVDEIFDEVILDEDYYDCEVPLAGTIDYN